MCLQQMYCKESLVLYGWICSVAIVGDRSSACQYQCQHLIDMKLIFKYLVLKAQHTYVALSQFYKFSIKFSTVPFFVIFSKDAILFIISSTLYWTPFKRHSLSQRYLSIKAWGKTWTNLSKWINPRHFGWKLTFAFCFVFLSSEIDFSVSINYS